MKIQYFIFMYTLHLCLHVGLGTYDVVGNPERVKGDIDGETIVDIASRSDAVLALNVKGQVFGWGNSEYSQFSMVTKETQVNFAQHLPFQCGHVTGVAAGGSMCALLNGMYLKASVINNHGFSAKSSAL